MGAMAVARPRVGPGSGPEPGPESVPGSRPVVGPKKKKQEETGGIAEMSHACACTYLETD